MSAQCYVCNNKYDKLTFIVGVICTDRCNVAESECWCRGRPWGGGVRRPTIAHSINIINATLLKQYPSLDRRCYGNGAADRP